MLLKQILYLGHWIIKLDMQAFLSYLNYAQKKRGINKIVIIVDIIYCVLAYKISILEYFQFSFYHKEKKERKTYVGTPWHEEFMAKMNPRAQCQVLDDKTKFLKAYTPFIKRHYATLTDFESDNESARKMLHGKSGKIVLKNRFGEGGKGIEITTVKNLDTKAVLKRLIETNNDFVEECLVQHKEMMKLSPSGVNTLRIITQINGNNEVNILGTILRISVNCPVDNWHSGNMAALINPSTGIVESPAFYMDVTKLYEEYHPVTGIKIVGFKIPFWKEALQMAKDAALYNTKNKSIGWDIAITDEGPAVIEGNNGWDKVIWQRAYNKGLKPVISSYQ